MSVEVNLWGHNTLHVHAVILFVLHKKSSHYLSPCHWLDSHLGRDKHTERVFPLLPKAAALLTSSWYSGPEGRGWTCWTTGLNKGWDDVFSHTVFLRLSVWGFHTPDALRHTYYLNTGEHPHTRREQLSWFTCRTWGAVNFCSTAAGASGEREGDPGTKTNMFHLTCECVSDCANTGWR